MSNDAAIEIVRSRIAAFRSLAGSVSTAVVHSGLKGTFREIFVQDLLSPYLPKSIEVLSGTILFPGGQSRDFRNQDDVILFDQLRSPLLLGTSSRESIIPVSGVRAQIEVKSMLQKVEIIKLIHAAAEISQYTPQAWEAPIGAVFALDTDIGESVNILELIQEATLDGGYRPNSGQVRYPIQVICIVGRGTWLNVDPRSDKQKAGWYFVKPKSDEEILAFLGVISNTVYSDLKSGAGIGPYILKQEQWICLLEESLLV